LTHHVHGPLSLLLPSEPEAIITDNTKTSFLQPQKESSIYMLSRQVYRTQFLAITRLFINHCHLTDSACSPSFR